MFVGQRVIHGDTHTDNGKIQPGDFSPGHSFAFEWLRHVYEGGWQYYFAHNGDAQGQQALAFAYGFLTHAAGDMWAHTLVNSYSRGVFPGWTDVSNIGIAVRHVVLEMGFISAHTPVTNLTMARNSPTLADFVYWDMIASGKEGGFVDSANNDTYQLGREAIFTFFFNLRWALSDRLEAVRSLGPLNPIYIAAIPLMDYVDNWIAQIDLGLKAWPLMSQEVAFNLVTTVPMNWGGAGDAAYDFVLSHVVSMLGFPDGTSYVLDAFVDVIEAFGGLIEPLVNVTGDFFSWIIKMATGSDLSETISYMTTPINFINNSTVGFGSDTSTRLDALMGIPPDSSDPFDPNVFAAFKNTVTTAKLVLLTPDSLNQMLYDHRVGPIFHSGSYHSDRDNFMLGFIRTLDGHEQWRKSTDVTYSNSPAGTKMGEGMPIWTDCLARDRVFRVIYTPWTGQDFNDNGEVGEDISATPPPASAFSVLGRTFSNGATTFVGGATTFQISATADHYWNSNEMAVTGQITPGGGSSTGQGPIVIGPITGADGLYTIDYHASGLCISGPPHGERDRSVSFTLDKTPPALAILPPAAGLVLDVTQTTSFSFSVTDNGSGLASSGATLDGAPIFTGVTIDAFLQNAGFHNLVATGTDNIGNVGSLTRTFRVSATIAGLKAAVTRAYAEKLMTIPPKDVPIQSKLDSAQKSLDTGKVATAKNTLSALANQVSKYIGNGVDPAFGKRFVGWIHDLVSRL